MSFLAVPRLVVLGVTLAGLIVWALWVRKNPDRWGYAVPPFSWLIHVLLFYLFILVVRDWWGMSLGVDFELWSIILRLHAAFLIAGIGIVMYLERIVINRAAG